MQLQDVKEIIFTNEKCSLFMISIKDLQFSYKQTSVYNRLSVEFDGGYVYGLFGKNGSGKSTLFRLIYGMLFPSAGHVKIDGEESKYRHPGLLEKIYMVPEEMYLPAISLNEYVTHLSRFYPNFKTDDLNKYIEEFEIPQVKRIDRLSYGQKKKLIISIGLAINTPVLLMDEPTNGLDIMSKAQFKQVIKKAIAKNRCIIISTHQAKDLENLIDRLTIIDEGKILFDKPLDEVAMKYKFLMLKNDETIDKNVTLYSEQLTDGTIVITENKSNIASKIDLEILYKAIMNNPNQFCHE